MVKYLFQARQHLSLDLNQHHKVKVKDGVDLETATFEDIAENPKNLKFDHSIDPALLVGIW
jgi:ABC-type metal ion transport system substrate-binding protein